MLIQRVGRRAQKLPDWTKYIQDAGNLHGTGFHFDEEGYYGLILAVHAALRVDGLDPQIKQREAPQDGWLIWVTALEHVFDWEGAAFSDAVYYGTRVVGVEEMPEIVAGHNPDYPWEQVEADTSAFAEVIETAREIAAGGCASTAAALLHVDAGAVWEGPRCDCPACAAVRRKALARIEW